MAEEGMRKMQEPGGAWYDPSTPKPGPATAPVEPGSYDESIKGLSPETQDRLKNGPHGVSITKIEIIPGPRYGKPAEAPRNLREAPEIPGEGYTRGSRYGDNVIEMFGMKKKRRE